jgi:antibiotic biosynthesis monooxygenase (ABM) superfamily enzyme
MSRWVRSAFWTGSVKAGSEAKFQQAINAELIPGMLKVPGVAAARALWPMRLQDHPPAIACQILVEFDCFADLERMLASPERQALRSRVLAIAAEFDGILSHIDYEVA